jgi:anti-anti-sigma factor
MTDLVDVAVQQPRADVAVVEIKGEHDAATSAQLQQLLEGVVARNDLIVVDLSQAEFIDSSVITALLRAHREATERNKTFRLQFGTALIVRRMLEISGLLRSSTTSPPAKHSPPQTPTPSPRRKGSQLVR